MTRIWYDTEFLEDGKTIDLISIGMVREDGRELYLINNEIPLHLIVDHRWLMENVVPSLPLGRDQSGKLFWNTLHPDYASVSPLWMIRNAVHDFIQGAMDPDDRDASLWAWYGAYDHVALCQLWGPMANLPPGIPMWTNDLKQEAMRLGNPEIPKQLENAHNALADARHNRVIDGFLARHSEKGIWTDGPDPV